MKKNEFTELKILLLGHSDSNKTQILHKFINNSFENNNSNTIGVDFECKPIEYKDKKYLIKLFDTAGQERFQSITKSYYRMGDGFFIVFDMTNEDTLKSVTKLIESIIEEIEDAKIIILGNNCELKDKLIPDDIIKQYVGEYKFINSFFF